MAHDNNALRLQPAWKYADSELSADELAERIAALRKAGMTSAANKLQNELRKITKRSSD